MAVRSGVSMWEGRLRDRGIRDGGKNGIGRAGGAQNCLYGHTFSPRTRGSERNDSGVSGRGRGFQRRLCHTYLIAVRQPHVAASFSSSSGQSRLGEYLSMVSTYLEDGILGQGMGFGIVL